MSDVLIGDHGHHPSLKLSAGQVVGFAQPEGGVTCTICGVVYSDTDYHPEGSTTPDGALTFGGDIVTFGGDIVVYGV
jgi:hypothetical protein